MPSYEIEGVIGVDIGRLDSFQTRLTQEQKAKLSRMFQGKGVNMADDGLGTLVESALEKLLFEIKESIGFPLQIDPMPFSLVIKTPYAPLSLPFPFFSNRQLCSKIDPTRIIYRLDISRSGISRSQKTFNPADISSLYVSKDILPDPRVEGEVGYKSLDDVREGFVAMKGMVKITGPKEMGSKMGTVEFEGVINVDSGEIVVLKEAILRVMGKKILD